MAESAPDYLPLWLTPQEHQTLFGELLAAPEGEKAARVAELLQRADARAKDTPVFLSLQDGAVRLEGHSSTRSVLTDVEAQRFSVVARLRIFLIATAGIALLGILISLFLSRAVR